MKATFVFLIVAGIIIQIKFGEQKQSLMPQAVYQVIKQHFVKNGVQFEIVFNSKDLVVLEKTLKLVKELKDYRVNKIISGNDSKTFDLQHSAVFLFDSFESFVQFEFEVAKNGPKEVNLLIYCADLKAEFLENFQPEDDQIFSFLIEEEGQIILKSLTLFTPQKCRSPQPIEVNKFSRKSMQWTEKTFFMTTIRDFHGCKLLFGVTQSPPMVSLVKLPNGRQFVTGTAVIIVKFLAPHLNYEIELAYRDNGDSRVADYELGSYVYIDHLIFYERDITEPLETQAVVVAVPHGEPYTSIEKFFLPFDLTTWLLFLLVFAVAFSVVAIAKISRSNILQIFVFGENVTSPALNIFATFMGIGQQNVPSRNVSRILLMNLILFSLIMRTAYQGKAFEFLTKDMRKTEVQTVEELLEKNYTLYVNKQTNWSYSKDLLYFDSLKRLNYIQVESLRTQVHKDLQNSSFKGAAMDLAANFHDMDGTIKFPFLERKVITFNWGIAFYRNSFLSAIFRKKIVQFVTGGIYQNAVPREYIMRKPGAKPYDTVLNMTHLSVGFYIWLLMCLLSSCAFIAEILVWWTPKVVKMILFYFILDRFYKLKVYAH